MAFWPGLRAVERYAFRLGIDIEDTLSAPRVGIRIVLHGSQAPLLALRHRVGGNGAQKTKFLVALRVHSLDQRLQIGRISSAIHLGLKSSTLARLLVVVDRVAHLPQRTAELFLPLALNRDSGQRQRHQGENRQNGRRDDQLQER